MLLLLWWWTNSSVHEERSSPDVLVLFSVPSMVRPAPRLYLLLVPPNPEAVRVPEEEVEEPPAAGRLSVYDE